MQPEEKPKQTDPFSVLNLSFLVTEFGAVTGSLLVVLGLVGKHLDQTKGGKTYTLLGIILALLLSFSFIYKRLKEILYNNDKR